MSARPIRQLYRQDEERALAKAIDAAKRRPHAAVAREDFEAPCARWRSCARTSMPSSTRSPSTSTTALRENRLKLLNEIRAATRAVADFSRIEG